MPRRGGHPVAVLVILTLVVAVPLALAWRWADGKAAAPEIAAPASITTDGDAVDVSLATPVLSVRRAPGILSRNVNLDAFEQALQPLVNGLNDTSCASVSV